MSKNRKQYRSQTFHAKPTPSAPALHTFPGVFEGIQLFLVGTFVTARYLLPAESAPLGDTLHIVLGWLIVAILFSVTRLIDGSRTVRIDRFDIGVWLLVSGQVSSTFIMIYFSEGQQRAALNMMWEWVSMGLTFSLTRRLIVTPQLRTTLLQGFLATVVLLSLYGIWQHHWMYEQLSKEYLGVRQQLDTAVSPSIHAESQQKLLSMGVPADALSGSGRQLFEQRLLNSSEPLGMFALANTFAGLLAVGFLIAVAQAIQILFYKTEHMTSKWNRCKAWLLVLPPLLIGYCLILTKSRTAWIGVMGGFVSLALLKLIQNRQNTPAQRQFWKKRALKWGITGTVLLLGFFLLATFSGGFDRAVLTEAPKSLQYRLEYWTGTWEVIKENPLWGTGPGNFRNHYLKHKLPGSSEEIADPHNLFLDVWANAGIAAFAGLLLILFLACSHWIISPKTIQTDSKAETTSVRHSFSSAQVALVLGFALSFPLLWGVQLFLQSVDESLLWLFCPGWLVIYFALYAGWQAVNGADQMGSTSSLMPLALAAAFIALCVHLSGAGGIAMPAITQTWLLLLALAFPVISQRQDTDESSFKVKGYVHLPPLKTIHLKTLFLSVCVLLMVFFVMFTFAPTIQRKKLVREGEQALLRGQYSRIAQEYFRQASQADTLSPAPWQALATIQFNQGSHDRDAFEQGVKLQQAVIRRDPVNPLNYFELGHHFYQQYQVSKIQEDLAGAIINLEQAVTGYPNNARYRAVLAEVLSDAGQTNESLEQALRAMALDEANRRARHVDKYLTEETLSRMKQIISVSQRNQN